MRKRNKTCILLTKAAEEEKHLTGWAAYPRPQMKRASYQLLNQNWTLDGEPIRVPFVPQSVLSGYQGKVGKDFVYETRFCIPKDFRQERILLHFGAFDQIAEVWINDTCVGKHEDGYLAFSFDITEYVMRDGENKLVVKGRDALSKLYPYGKQCKNRGGMWYTPISGIWQSVWLENVPRQYIEKVNFTPDLEGVQIQVQMAGDTVSTTDAGVTGADFADASFMDVGTAAAGFWIEVRLHNGEILRKSFEGMEGYLSLKNHVCKDGTAYEPRLWTVEEPYLYEMKLGLAGADTVDSYFALRTISIEKKNGINRVCLNGSPIFLHGVLDQGYYSDGIYLPADPEEYLRDIQRMKELGINMLRKHIKVEPELFYYYCDKYGMLVMQDMVNSGRYSFLGDTALPTIGMRKYRDRRFGEKKRKEIFKAHVKGLISQVYNHPCIIAYTIFNEGWGQFDSDKMYEYVKFLDATRLTDSTSGWFWQKLSDFDSEHIYFKLRNLQGKERPLLVSECGGYSRTIENHCFNKNFTYGYGGTEDEAALTGMIENMYQNMILPGIEKGVCGCVYTQLSDVEDEVNGLYTYDRKVCKVNKEVMLSIQKRIEEKNL